MGVFIRTIHVIAAIEAGLEAVTLTHSDTTEPAPGASPDWLKPA